MLRRCQESRGSAMGQNKPDECFAEQVRNFYNTIEAGVESSAKWTLWLHGKTESVSAQNFSAALPGMQCFCQPC
jgi:hypothetical protein